MPDVIQCLWVGEVTRLERACIQSFVRQGHEVELYGYAWNDLLWYRGVHAKDANEIVPVGRLADFQNLSNFSDYFRDVLLYKKGGWWADLDVFLLKPFACDEEYAFSSQLVAQKTNDEVNCTVMKAPKGSPLMRWCVDHIETTIDTKTCAWSEIGPHTMLQAVAQFGLQNLVVPHWTFCPLHYFEAPNNFLAPSTANTEFDSETIGVHLWNEEMRRAGKDKDGSYPGSLYERLLSA